MKIFRKTEVPLTQQEITDWLRELRSNPYIPASGFGVTSIFRAKIGDDDGYYFAGVNVENLHHRMSTHGEEGAISALTTALGKHAQIVEGWVMGAPTQMKPGEDHVLANNKVSCCGKCRQQIAGLAEPSTVIHSVSLNGDHGNTTVGEFLPDAFTFRQFAPELVKNVSEHKIIHPPTVEKVEARLMRTGQLPQQEIFAWLQELESVDFASKTSHAVIVQLANDAYVAGVKVEEAAFVSIDPVQSAMAIANAEFGPQKVTQVWSFGKGRDEAILHDDAYTSLSLSGVQTLSQFTAHDAIPVHLINGNGEQTTIKLSDSARYAPTFSNPTAKIGPERFVK